MARIFESWFGHRPGSARALVQARASELRGDLAEAAALFAVAGRPDEAARVTILRGDREAQLVVRLRHYADAAATAPEASELAERARRKYALTVIAATAGGPLTDGLRRDLLGAAHELERLGEHERAAEAYARARDVEGHARALEHAGAIDELDDLLRAQQARCTQMSVRRHAIDEFDFLVASGARREAVALATASNDESLIRRGQELRAKRAAGCTVHAAVRGNDTRLLLGESVVVGRSPNHGSAEPHQAFIRVPSAALSRAHLAIARRDGGVVVRDLGSRHGTSLRGAPLTRDVPVDRGLELFLGGHVRLAIHAASDWSNEAVAIEIAGRRYIASLGACSLGIGRWRLERGTDDWVELSTDDAPAAFSAWIQWPKRATLVAGDAIASERGGPPQVTVLP
jgi:hypothetical protein